MKFQGVFPEGAQVAAARATTLGKSFAIHHEGHGLHAHVDTVVPAAEIDQRVQYSPMHVNHAPHSGMQGAFPMWEQPLRNTVNQYSRM